MDQVMVDCGDGPVGGGGATTAAEWADTLGTVHHAVVAGMARPRVIRTVPGRYPVALSTRAMS